MGLRCYPVTLTLLAITVMATPPPNYLKQAPEDKNPANYEYKYVIGDVDGKEGQGKAETRLGELASGRYYVNGGQSTTDVKYFADEWGYHPLVKYTSSGDHSSSTTHLAIGDHVVKSLLNETDVGEEVKLSREQNPNWHYRQQLYSRRLPAQVIQPYTSLIVHEGSVTGSSGETSRKSQSTEGRTVDGTDSSTASAVNSLLSYDLHRTNTDFNRNSNNYVTPSRFIEESTHTAGSWFSNNNRDDDKKTLSSKTSTTLDYRSHTHPNIYVTSSTTLRPLIGDKSDDSENFNSFLSTFPDDYLVVRNSGDFGRRLNSGYSKVHGNSIESDIHVKSTESSTPFSHGASTARTLSSASTSANTHSHLDGSSYASYSTTTPRITISHSSNLPQDLGSYSTTTISLSPDIQNFESPETSSDNYKNVIAKNDHDDALSDAYAGVLDKIFPKIQLNRENVNSLVTGRPQSIRSKESGKNVFLTKEDEVAKPNVSFYSKRRDHESYVTLKQSLDMGIQYLPVVRSSTPQSSSTFNSKPIVVAELLGQNRDKGFEYSTTFPCNDETETATSQPSTSSTPSSSGESVLVTPNVRATHSDITTSSLILNPIQAGVSLVNAGETELITSNAENTVRIPAPVTEDIVDVSGLEAIKKFSLSRGNELGKLEQDARVKVYEKINPGFGHPENVVTESPTIGKSMVNSGLAVGNVQNDVQLRVNSQDQQIEIQKSVEIYQNAPVREIHYPAQVISQVSDINHQQQQQQQQQQPQHQQNIDGVPQEHQDRSGYYQLQNLENDKQFNREEERYSIVQKEQHQSHDLQRTSDTARDGPTSGTVYIGNLIRHNTESGDDTNLRNSQNQLVNLDHEDHSNIIKLIRDNIPEVKYTPAKTPQINVQVYPSIVDQTDTNRHVSGYRDTAEVHQRAKIEVNDDQEGADKARYQLQRILSESASLQRYFSDAEWSNVQEQQEQRHQDRQQQAILEIMRLKPVNENTSEEVTDGSKPQQVQQQQSIAVPYGHYNFFKEKNVHGNLGNHVEDLGNPPEALPQLYETPVVAERIVEKTVNVPQLYPAQVSKVIGKKVTYPVEKIVEKPVPYPIEEIVEKEISVSQPYAVHVQVPVDRIVEKQIEILQPYPVHIEKIIEKKVPYPVHRLVPQPYPVHILQPYPVEKIIEKPVHVPVTVEKIVEKKVHVPHPYPVQVPIKVPYPIEVTKFVEQTVQVPYGVRYGVSYQQIMKPDSSHGLYGPQGSTSVPLYGLSLISNKFRDHNRENASQQLFQGYSYNKPAIAFVTGRVDGASNHQRTNGREQFVKSSAKDNQHHYQHHQGFAKKSFSGQASKLLALPYTAYGYTGVNRRQVSYRLANSLSGEKVGMKDVYVGPVPVVHQHKPQPPQQQVELSQSNSHQKSRSRSSSDQQQQLPLQGLQQQHSTAVTRAASVSTSVTSSRQARQQQQLQQQENQPHYQMGPGAFRQSKIEYGFKPPMVPSVQYDEKTAAKVEN